MNMTSVLTYYFLAVSVVTFIVYGIDKLKAKKSWRRISEFTLLMLAFMGGSAGAWVGMNVWRHKTRHKKFRYCVPVFLFLHIGLLFFCWYMTDQPALEKTPSRNQLQEKIDSLLSMNKVDVGVAVCYDGKIVCQANADKAFPMMSTFKLHQAVVVLNAIRGGSISLDSTVLVTKEMLRPNTYSPLRDAHPDGNIRLTMEDLLRYSLLQSDNNACDILFSLFGGIARVQFEMQKLGLCHTQIRWTEDEMHIDENRSTENFSTPSDAVRLVEIAYQDEWLRETLTHCATGQNRLPALLPRDKGIRIGHKTGTWGTMPDGTVNGINDTGFVILPDGRHYSIAVFCNKSTLSFEETESLIAQISLIVYDNIICKGGIKAVSLQC
ncbi:MAG: class A beta-lactamase [Prevotella sp.]|nr:class A beta-lactamase [Prevotella sp.]